MLYECLENRSKMEKSKKLAELAEMLAKHDDFVRQREEDYLELQCFIAEQESFDYELIVITKKNYNKFYSSNDEDRELDAVGYLDARNFFTGFGELIGQADLVIKESLVRWDYTDAHTYNGIELVININNKEETFIVDVV
jgi:hypothetical protein